MAQKRKAKKLGRPRLPKGEAKGRIVPVRFRVEDLKAIEAAARRNKQTVSEWVRNTVVRQSPIAEQPPNSTRLVLLVYKHPVDDHLGMLRKIDEPVAIPFSGSADLWAKVQELTWGNPLAK